MLRKKHGLYILSFFIFLIVLEVAIRYSGLYAQLSEKNGHAFLSLFEPTHHGQFQNYIPNDTLHIDNTEFSYLHYIDKYGFRNSNSVDTLKTVDILALGDSFTEGLGAPQDSSWPATLARENGWTVYNAGVMGSDPVFGSKIVQEDTFYFYPKRVVFAVNYSDITDMVIRGGMERFDGNGGVQYKPAPWFMPIYKHFHLFRAILHLVFKYDYMFTAPQRREEVLDKALFVLTSTLVDANQYCQQKGIQMYVFVHPIPQEYYMNLDRRLNFRKIDTLVDFLQAKKLRAFNLREGFEEQLKTDSDWKSASWQLDGHFNGKGYGIMAELIAKAIVDDTSTVY